MYNKLRNVWTADIGLRAYTENLQNDVFDLYFTIFGSRELSQFLF